jgi:hypothetical protein
MQASLSRADVIYEVFFKRPLFWSHNGPPLVQLVFDALSENFTVAIADINVNPGPSPSQIVVAIPMFGGAGSIELRVDRWRGTFRNIASQQDRSLILRCLNVASGAIHSSSDRSAPIRAVAAVATWYKCDLELLAVGSLLAKYWLASNELEPGFLGAAQIEYSLNPRLKNPTEGWDGLFLAQTSVAEGTQLFFHYTGTYISGGRYNSIDQQLDHAQTMIAGMLGKLGFKLPSGGDEQGD